MSRGEPGFENENAKLILEKEGSSGIYLDAKKRNPDRPGRASRQRCIFASIILRLMILKIVAADAGEGDSRLPKQNTGGSDALCLAAPPVSGKP